MAIIDNNEELEKYIINNSLVFSQGAILLDGFLSDAIEMDVDLISDGEDIYIAGITEHIEEAGIHSGDSSCVFPPYKIPHEIINNIKAQSKDIALTLGAKGFINIQFAIKDKDLYILEVNPRASRTIPFLAKATHVNLVQIATAVILGKKLKELNIPEVKIKHVSVKAAVFPFSRFPGVDVILGPEMKSTGEVMGIDYDFASSFAKAHIAAGNLLPVAGCVFISVKDSDKSKACEIAKTLVEIGFTITATKGTSRFLNENGINAEPVNKVWQGRPHIVDMLISNKIALVINTSQGSTSIADSASIRITALSKKVPYCTTITAADALVFAIRHIKNKDLSVESLQNFAWGK